MVTSLGGEVLEVLLKKKKSWGRWDKTDNVAADDGNAGEKRKGRERAAGTGAAIGCVR